ncbi:MAG TPA: DNA repair protein RecN [Candidatus Saccharimonadales bacterium]|nr:DNA repair protein RecN [Candidatus Saccharimonadales bacterium]
MDDRTPGRQTPGRLLELTVTDLALIDRLRLELAPGLNVLTGETGAGKSLLIDAVGLALGARADSGLVRHGADVARVEALFDRSPEPLICVREVTSLGRSTARIDDETVTAARLADVAGPLVEIHGQHEQQRLLDARWQRDVLDSFGGHEAARVAMTEAVGHWRTNRAQLTALTIDPRELARQLAIHEHEAAEIAAAHLQPGEAHQIRARLEAAQHGEAIARGGGQLHESLAGEPGGARESIGAATHHARQLARLDGRFAPLAERLAGLEAEVEDVASEARALVDGLDHDPAELARLEERLSLIFALERRYGDDEAAVLAYGDRAAAETVRLRGVEGERGRRAAEDAQLLAVVAQAAAALSALRSGAARELGREVGMALAELGFGQSAFEVALGRRTASADEPAIEVDGDAVAFDSTGMDEVVYRLAPNPGEPARPLARIASGGEMSRVALAIKEVLAAADATPTLIFDEVDTGIGGRSADPVGRSLWVLGRRHQVLCVTHLPQIAAHADAHFQIAKRERDGRTVTEVRPLDREGRIVELAQMLGGAGGSTAAMAGARELLDRAEAWRVQLATAG